MKKALVLYSGGLDSRLVVKIMIELGFEVTALHFVLPFGCNCSISENKKFIKENGAKIKIIDVTKGILLKKYLYMLKNARFGYGKGFNPCTDCKIWIFKEAKKIFDKEKFDVIASGEVLNQRPMSQTENKKNIIDNEINFDMLRPLSAKKLTETIYEKSGIIDRNKLYEINGRRRITQIELAKKFKINYPTPAGGCLLCEKMLKNRFKYFLENNFLNIKTIKLVKIGRHFVINNNLYIIARNETEGEILSKFKKNIITGSKGKPTVYFYKNKDSKILKILQQAFSSGEKEYQRNLFNKYKL